MDDGELNVNFNLNIKALNENHGIIERNLK